MVVDSSALLAILKDGPERRALIGTRRGPAAARYLDTLAERTGIEVVGVYLELGELVPALK